MQTHSLFAALQIDYTFAALLAVGMLLIVVGGIWLLVRAFQQSVVWGLLCLLVPGAAIVFFFVHFNKAFLPTGIALLGLLFCASPAYNLLNPPPIQDTAQEEQKKVKDPTGEVKTETRITLTGAKREEYAKLWKQDTYAVIQWANEDVSDDDTVKLEGMKQLREIDLNSSKITNKTLEVLGELKTLEIIRIANTKATPEGVEKLLLNLPNLKELDARGLKVPGKVLRDWKAKDQQNRKFLN
jgi:hypothetical protein